MKRSYFDHNATTPVSPQVAQTMVEILTSTFGNASSIHREGQAARRIIEKSRREIAVFFGVTAPEIIFTSGGTESNNLAIFGLVRNAPNDRKHVITTTIEHPSVLEPCRQLENEGVEVTYLPVDRNGRISLADIENAIRPETVLISVMHANNEVGTLQPMAEIAAIVRTRREQGQQVYFHSDGIQAPGRVETNLPLLGVDLYSVSAHKVGAPKGTGALYVRKGVPLRSVQFGGRHERERRAGTENVAGAAAFSRALEIVDVSRFTLLSELRNRFEQAVLAGLPHIHINGAGADRLPNTSNLYFGSVDGESLVIALDLMGFAVSSGSACSSGSIAPSPVLLAMGRSQAEARRSVRFSFGVENTVEETDALAVAAITCVTRLRGAGARSNSPEMYVHV
jgi:cysteine desulfurase